MKTTPRRGFLTLISLSALLLLGWGQSAQAKSKGLAASTPKGQKLYTRFSLFYEDLRHRTTNYRKGVLVPVNTEVAFVKARGNDIIVTFPGGQELWIQNIGDYSGENLDGIFTRTFSKEKTDLSAFTEEEQNMIKTGEVKQGMRKSAVIVALGCPPKHKTPTLESPEWRYWRNRVSSFIVRFDDDKVANVER